MLEVKALACALPAESGRPLSRWSAEELKREVLRQGIVASISGSTIWRWLGEDAIRPWSRRSWIFPRDPRFAEKAAPVLDLYGRCLPHRLEPPSAWRIFTSGGSRGSRDGSTG